MGLGTRGSWALLFVGALLVLALLKVAVEGGDSAGTVPPLPPDNRNGSSSTTVKPSTTSVFGAIVNTLKSTVKPTSVTVVTKNVTAGTTSKTSTTSQVTTTPGISANTPSTTLKSTPKITSVSQNTSQVSTSTMAASHNSSVTSVPSSVTITATINSKENKGSKFDIGSFVGGIALTLGILSILYIGCKVYYSRRGIQYRTIDEHDAII